MPSLFLGQKAFLDAGHEVVYAFASGRNHSYDYHGIRIEEFRVPLLHDFMIHRPWIHRFSQKLFWLAFLIVGAWKGIRIARRFRPDVIYGHFLHAAPVAWMIGRLRGVPNITRMYGTFLFPHLDSLWGRMKKFEEILAYKVPCRYFIMTDDGTRGDECAAVLGVTEDRIKFWRNGIDKDMYDPSFDASSLKQKLSIPDGHKLIVAISRLAKWKGVDRLITALPAVLETHPETTAIVVGDGEERANLEALGRGLGVAENLRFTGLVLHGEVADYLNAADVFVSLYDVSNVGNPLLEALCCGKCIVTLDTGSTNRIIQDGVNGVLLKASELTRLPGLLSDLLKDDARRKRLGAAARNYAATRLQTRKERAAMEVRLIEQLVGAPVLAV